MPDEFGEQQWFPLRSDYTLVGHTSSLLNLWPTGISMKTSGNVVPSFKVTVRPFPIVRFEGSW
jgi:hypothetical protein